MKPQHSHDFPTHLLLLGIFIALTIMSNGIGCHITSINQKLDTIIKHLDSEPRQPH